MWHSSGYYVWVSEAEIWNWGRIAIAWRRYEGWQLEGETNYGPNMVSFMITVGWNQWYVIRAYIPPNYYTKMKQVDQTLSQCPV